MAGEQPSGVSRVFSKTLERAAAVPPMAGGVLRHLLEIAIDGRGPLPSARAAAGRHLQRAAGDAEAAVDSVVLSHIALAGAQGFVTNLGGFAMLPIMLPANLTGVAVVQARMVASVLHLRGYDVNDNRVRTAVVMSLLGGEEIARRIARGKLPAAPMVIATAPVFDPALDRDVAAEVLMDLTTRVGGKRVALTVMKRVPIVGGGVGAAYDAYTTRQIGVFATNEFRRRRALA